MLTEAAMLLTAHSRYYCYSLPACSWTAQQRRFLLDSRQTGTCRLLAAGRAARKSRYRGARVRAAVSAAAAAAAQKLARATVCARLPATGLALLPWPLVAGTNSDSPEPVPDSVLETPIRVVAL